jgi:hypothetical protein
MRTVQPREHRRRLAVDRRRDHETSLQLRARVRNEARTHQQVLMPEHRHDGALLTSQRRQPIEVDEAQPRRAPQRLDDQVGKQRRDPIQEHPGRRQLPLRLRSMGSHGHDGPQANAAGSAAWRATLPHLQQQGKATL